MSASSYWKLSRKQLNQFMRVCVSVSVCVCVLAGLANLLPKEIVLLAQQTFLLHIYMKARTAYNCATQVCSKCSRVDRVNYIYKAAAESLM